MISQKVLFPKMKRQIAIPKLKFISKIYKGTIYKIIQELVLSLPCKNQ